MSVSHYQAGYLVNHSISAGQHVRALRSPSQGPLIMENVDIIPLTPAGFIPSNFGCRINED